MSAIRKIIMSREEREQTENRARRNGFKTTT